MTSSSLVFDHERCKEVARKAESERIDSDERGGYRLERFLMSWTKLNVYLTETHEGNVFEKHEVNSLSLSRLVRHTAFT